ncbi:MAG: Uma2 family endonuclease [Armatimonadota bacterium]|nr:Uma2 family endonuclease [Armatimonadota bacterium]
MTTTLFQSPEATIEDLVHVPDSAKAEIVHGKLVLMSPAGIEPGYAGDEFFISLREYAHRTRSGRAVGDNKGFRVSLPHRKSFSPDAAYNIGHPTGMGFYEGAPIFAVEVRSENDYGPAAEWEMASKRADYFACGTQVVWDVDLVGDGTSDKIVKVYRARDPESPTIYRSGELAEAEPALPGWQFPVDSLDDLLE